jgi:hypothetical protein
MSDMRIFRQQQGVAGNFEPWSLFFFEGADLLTKLFNSLFDLNCHIS